MHTDQIRIAWLLTSAFYYWQPAIGSLTQRFPQTTVFTSRWHGFASGCENAFRVEIVGQRKVVSIISNPTGYGHNFTHLPIRIVGRLLRFQPDVVFSNSFGVWTMLALLFKRVGKWRVVIAYEGSSPSVDYRHSAVRIRLRRIMVKAADACITNSQAGASYLMDWLRAQPDRIFVQPYEIPSIRSFAAGSPAVRCAAHAVGLAPLKRPCFLFVGGIIPRKGLQLLLEACRLLSAQGDPDYTLLVVGDGVYRRELERFCQHHDLTHHVNWIGQVDYGCLGAYFRQADALVLPTLEDTWGVVVLEAMVFGKPVLCSRRAGASELVIDGENGFCFDPEQPEQLADLMRYCITHADALVKMGQQSQAIMARHTPDIAARFLGHVTTYVLTHA